MMRGLVLLGVLATSRSFSPVLRSPVSRWTLAPRAASSGDEAYARAEHMSAKFGSNSPEAKLAWEAVNDIEDGDERLDTTAPPLDEACTVENDADMDKCKEFDQQMELLRSLQKTATNIHDQIEQDIMSLETLKLQSQAVETGTIDEGAYARAVSEAKAAAAEFGAESREAMAAWAIVSEIEAADDEKINTRTLEEECLTSNSQKCLEYQMALDTLNNAIITSPKTEYNKSV